MVRYPLKQNYTSPFSSVLVQTNRLQPIKGSDNCLEPPQLLEGSLETISFSLIALFGSLIAPSPSNLRNYFL